MGTESFQGVMKNVFKIDCDDGCTTLNILKTIDLYTLGKFYDM